MVPVAKLGGIDAGQQHGNLTRTHDLNPNQSEQVVWKVGIARMAEFAGSCERITTGTKSQQSRDAEMHIYEPLAVVNGTWGFMQTESARTGR
jgi:hypothetical protein